MSQVLYPKSCVWYIEAWSKKSRDSTHSAGSAVCVRLRTASDAAPRKFLLTCSHVTRSESPFGRPGAGELRPWILCWPPGRGYVPVRDENDWNDTGSGGIWTAKVVDVFDRSSSSFSEEDSEGSRDWILLDVDQSNFQDYPCVSSWTDTNNDDLSAIGYPAGATGWSPGTIVESVSVRGFRIEVSADTPAMLALTGSGETRPGMSGGGLFNTDGNFVGLHRARRTAALRTSAIRSRHIEQELASRGYSTVNALPDSVVRTGAPADVSSPMSEFNRFVKDAGSVYSKIAYGVMLAPIMTYFTGFASPFPNEAFMGLVASIAAFFSLMIAFQLWLHGDTTKARREKLLVRNGIAALCCLIGYTGLFSTFVVSDPQQESKKVVGFTLQPDVEIVRDSQSPPMSDRQLLENLGGEPERIWTKLSLSITRMGMLTGWILTWFLLTLTIGVFLCDSWLRTNNAKFSRALRKVS